MSARIKERLDRLLTQYRESPNLIETIRSQLIEVERASDALAAIPASLQLDTATGDQLTILGKRLGWPRKHCICTTTPVFGFENDFPAPEGPEKISVMPAGASEDLTTDDWGTPGATIAEDVATSPFGDTNVDKLVENAAGGAHLAELSLSLESGETYRVSAFLKASGRDRISVYGVNPSNATIAGAVFDLTGGTVVAQNGAGDDPTIEDEGDGWSRVSFLISPAATGTFRIRFRLSSGGTSLFPSYAGDGVSGVNIWGVDATEGTDLFPYIPPDAGIESLAYAGPFEIAGLGDENSNWAAYDDGGIADFVIADDEIYRKFLKVRILQSLGRFDLDTLRAAVRTIWPDAWVPAYDGRGVVIAPMQGGLDVSLLQLWPRVLPVSVGVPVYYHLGLSREIFGFGCGWAGLASEGDDIRIATEDGDTLAAEDGFLIAADVVPTTNISDWLYPVESSPC